MSAALGSNHPFDSTPAAGRRSISAGASTVQQAAGSTGIGPRTATPRPARSAPRRSRRRPSRSGGRWPGPAPLRPRPAGAPGPSGRTARRRAGHPPARSPGRDPRRPARPPRGPEASRRRPASPRSVLVGVVQQVVEQLAQERGMGPGSTRNPARRHGGRPRLASADGRPARCSAAQRCNSIGSTPGNPASASARLRNSSASTICASCPARPRAEVSARRYSSPERSCRRATWSWPMRMVSGVRNWWEASPLNRLCRS